VKTGSNNYKEPLDDLFCKKKKFSHTYFSDIANLYCTNIFKMNPAQKAAVAIFAVVIMSFYLANVEASPRIRSMRAQYQYMSKRNGNSIDTNDAHPSCHESLICGFAYYDTSRSRIRPIISYRRSNLCRCDDGYRCVLTGNMSDRKAYVFHCREREKSQHMYEFPHNQYRGR